MFELKDRLIMFITRLTRKPPLWNFLILSLFILPSQTIAQGSGAAPPRPECTEGAPCGFNATNGLEGARIVLFDPGGGHSTSKRFLREALEWLANQYGFILDRKTNINDLNDSIISDAKIIIYSSTDGDVGGAIPNHTVRELVENFVQERGWGLLLIHAACSFIDSWPFLQDACIQQYFHHSPSGTQAELYVEDRRVEGKTHGRANPYTSFLFEGFPDRKTMRDEWHSCLRDDPRTTHQYGDTRNAQIQNRIMLTALDRNSFSQSWACREDSSRTDNPSYVAWTHTMGNGIVINNNYGHDDVWGTNEEDYGEELLWRYLRYVAKDWGPVPITEVSPDKNNTNACCSEISFTGFQNGNVLIAKRREFKISVNGKHQLEIRHLDGEVVRLVKGNGPMEYSDLNLKPGLYLLNLHMPDERAIVKKLLIQ